MIKRLILFILILFTPVLCMSDAGFMGDESVLAVPSATPACADSSCSGFIVCQNFEGTGYDNSETWSETIGTNGIVDEDQTTTLLRGSQTIQLYAGDSGQNSQTLENFTAISGSAYAHFMFRTASLPTSAGAYVFSLTGSEDLNMASVELRTDGNLRYHHYGQYTTSSESNGTPLSADTDYYIWLEYSPGSGTDGTGSIFVSTTTTKPANPAMSITNGTGTSNIEVVKLRAYNQQTYYFDQVLVSASSIGDVCD